MYSKLWVKDMRILWCMCAEKYDKILVNDSAAFAVCKVAKTKWPVSAAIRAVSVVSLSLNSPTSITSGSCLKALFKAGAKPFTSIPISLWLIVDSLSWKLYSIGSSIVIIWWGWVRFIFSTIAARVVDLPLPVAPVTRTKPLFKLGICWTVFGKISSSIDLISVLITLKTSP